MNFNGALQGEIMPRHSEDQYQTAEPVTLVLTAIQLKPKDRVGEVLASDEGFPQIRFQRPTHRPTVKLLEHHLYSRKCGIELVIRRLQKAADGNVGLAVDLSGFSKLHFTQYAYRLEPRKSGKRILHRTTRSTHFMKERFNSLERRCHFYNHPTLIKEQSTFILRPLFRKGNDASDHNDVAQNADSVSLGSGLSFAFPFSSIADIQSHRDANSDQQSNNARPKLGPRGVHHTAICLGNNNSQHVLYRNYAQRDVHSTPPPAESQPYSGTGPCKG